MGHATAVPRNLPPPAITGQSTWVRLLLGLVLVFGLFHGSANALESDRGQHGVLVALLVVAATIVADRWLLRRPRAGLIGRLGLGRPRAAAIVWVVTISAVMGLATWLWTVSREARVTFYPGWMWLLPGLFAQAGIAEEVLFRAYLFGQVRVGRTFWRAAGISMLPFVAVHLILFASMPWPVALAAVLLSVILSFPLAYLFELGGDTVWAPALLHFVIQAVPKVLQAEPDAASFALVWMVASAIVPFVVFAQRRVEQRFKM